MLLAVMAVAASLQHSAVQLFVAKFPGNKFFNGVLFGVAEVLAMLFSNLLLIYLQDIVAFRIVFFAGVISYITLVICHEFVSPIATYAAIVALIGSIGS